MPEGMRGQMKEALTLHANRRKELIKGIVDNSQFKEDELKNWGDEQLTKLHASLVKEGDYTPLGVNSFSNSGNQDDNEEITAMLSFEKPKKEEHKAA